MRIIDIPISIEEFRNTCCTTFDRMVKIDVDVELGIIAADAEMHADLEEALLENGSQQQSIWGANIYPDETGDGYLEYTSLINIRPSVGNLSMEVESSNIRAIIKAIVDRLVVRGSHAA